MSPAGPALTANSQEHRVGPPRRSAAVAERTDRGVPQRVGTGFSPADGPEFSPDGTHLYFNSEVASDIPGHAQLFRVALADDEVEQLTDDERVNWFQHVSPNGRLVSYLSYPSGTQGHPAVFPYS